MCAGVAADLEVQGWASDPGGGMWRRTPDGVTYTDRDGNTVEA
jgi:hypothetical protein